MKIPEGLKCEITPEMAYPNGVPEIPEGFEFVRFGPANTGESYLLRSGRYISAASDDSDCPSIIVRKKPQPPPRKWVVEFYGMWANADHQELESCDRMVRVIREVKPTVSNKPQPPRKMRGGPNGYVHDELYDCEEEGCVPICEPKHITRQRVYELARSYDLLNLRVDEFIVSFLRSLGVEVQD